MSGRGRMPVLREASRTILQSRVSTLTDTEGCMAIMDFPNPQFFYVLKDNAVCHRHDFTCNEGVAASRGRWRKRLWKKRAIVGNVFRAETPPPFLVAETWDKKLRNTRTWRMYRYPIRDGTSLVLRSIHRDQHRGCIDCIFQRHPLIWRKHFFRIWNYWRSISPNDYSWAMFCEVDGWKG